MLKIDKRIFIINGSGGVGKDTFVKHIKFAVDEYTNKEVWNFSSVDKVKEVATQIGWDGGKTEKDRKFLSDLKILTTEYNDMPFNSMKEQVAEFNKNKNAIFLFLHIREPKEIKRAKQEFNATTILIKRDSVPHIVSNMADGGVFDYDYDIVVDNNGNKEDFEIKSYDIAYDLCFENVAKSHYVCKEIK